MDLIYKDAAIYALANMPCKSDEDGYVWIIRSDAWARIDALPPAQPERNRGEWVGSHVYCEHLNEEAKLNGKTERYLPSGMVLGVYCNQCWCRADKRSNFCPNCGADMRGEQNEPTR